MKKLFFFFLLLSLFSSCLEVEEAQKSNGPTPQFNYYDAIVKWDTNTVIENDLNLKISDEFSDAEVEDIIQMIQTWNDAHDDITFMNENPARTSNLDTDDLNSYKDNILGIYKSYNWFDELSSFALGVTQFFAIRKNIGTPAEYLQMLHADIIINYKDYIYDDASIDFSGYDLYSILLHEMGHFIGLKHTNHFDDIMNPYLDTNEFKHSLSQNDVNILNDLYRIENTNLLMRKSITSLKKNNLNENDEVEIIRGIIEIFPHHYCKIRFLN